MAQHRGSFAAPTSEPVEATKIKKGMQLPELVKTKTQVVLAVDLWGFD